MSKQLKRWTFVYHQPTEELRIAVIKRLKEVCGRWVFQLERGEEGGLHWQGRVSFKQSKRMSECAGWIGLPPEHAFFKPEHDSVAGDFYCTKEESREEGPWSDKDRESYIPRQVRELALRPWQQAVIDMMAIWDTRHVDVLVDEEGNTGKTTLVTYAGVHGLAKKLPFCNDYKDILRMCYDVGPKRGYFIDIPRAISKDRLFQMYGAIEEIKSGYCYDDRYSFKDRYFDCPAVWVFTNKMPDEGLLSRDRWRIWRIQSQNLVRVAE